MSGIQVQMDPNFLSVRCVESENHELMSLNKDININTDLVRGVNVVCMSVLRAPTTFMTHCASLGQLLYDIYHMMTVLFFLNSGICYLRV